MCKEGNRSSGGQKNSIDLCTVSLLRMEEVCLRPGYGVPWEFLCLHPIKEKTDSSMNDKNKDKTRSPGARYILWEIIEERKKRM